MGQDLRWIEDGGSFSSSWLFDPCVPINPPTLTYQKPRLHLRHEDLESLDFLHSIMENGLFVFLVQLDLLCLEIFPDFVSFQVWSTSFQIIFGVKWQYCDTFFTVQGVSMNSSQ